MSAQRHRRLWLSAALVATATTRAAAGHTQSATPAWAELARGASQGMAVTTEGRLFAAPQLTKLGGPQTSEGPVQAWAVVADARGTVYLGTGPEGQILRIDRSGVVHVHYTVEEPMVTALALAEDGHLLAGAAPGGAIYRIDAKGEGELWATTDERYVWSLAVARDGRVWAATGERGRVLVLGASGRVEVLFDGDEAHVVRLLPLPGGGMLAGGAGRGLVYRIDDEGHGTVLHDDELPEVTALSVEAGGEIVAALGSPPRAGARRPSVRLRLPDGVGVGATDEAVGLLEEQEGPTLRGVIEGIESRPEVAPKAVEGRIVRIAADGTVGEIWHSTDEVPFCLVTDASGRVVFGAGEPARIYRVEPDRDVALLATLSEAQLTAATRAGEAIVLATSNPAAAYRLEPQPVETATFISRPVDAGAAARWGSIRFRLEAPGPRTEFYTRTGNSREPDLTWSAWSAAPPVPEGGRVVSPDGRFCQFRVEQRGAEAASRIDRISLRYETYNRPPVLSGFRESRSTDHTALVFRGSASDPDGDPVELRLEFRSSPGAPWERGPLSPPGEFEREIAWPTVEVAEGEYEVRVVADDGPANAVGEERRTEGPAVPVVVDRTPPAISIKRIDASQVEIEVEDRWSEIESVHLVQDGRPRAAARSEDGVCDARRERFRLAVPGGSGWAVRGEDAAGNVAEVALSAPAASN